MAKTMFRLLTKTHPDVDRAHVSYTINDAGRIVAASITGSGGRSASINHELSEEETAKLKATLDSIIKIESSMRKKHKNGSKKVENRRA